MNEMKPEDVMMALECCEEKRDCNDCPYKQYHYDRSTGLQCSDYLRIDALALLREKDALIKHLDEDRLGWADEAVKVKMQLNEKNAEIDRLKSEMKILRCEDCWNLAQAEAVDKFVERLNETLVASGIYPAIVKSSIEKIKKEMKGK